MSHQIKPHEFQLNDSLNSATIITVVPVKLLLDGKMIARAVKSFGMQLGATLDVLAVDDTRERVLARSRWSVDDKFFHTRMVVEGMSEVPKQEEVINASLLDPWRFRVDGKWVDELPAEPEQNDDDDADVAAPAQKAKSKAA
jgi:hypothetical protein